MEQKHTPGPWRVATNDPTIVVTESLDENGNCFVVADVLNGTRRSTKEDEANASLIAAAPDMLAALEQIVSYSDSSTDPAIVSVARAAIAKATGSTP